MLSALLGIIIGLLLGYWLRDIRERLGAIAAKISGIKPDKPKHPTPAVYTDEDVADREARRQDEILKGLNP